MESNYRLLHKSDNTHLQTSLPVYFYGLPDSKIYLIYARFYEINFNKSGLEFVFAVLDDFYYDFELGQVITKDFKEINLSSFSGEVEKKEPQIRILKSYRNIKSFGEARQFLNKKAGKISKSYA
jgi:hypothetical protein